MKPLALVTVSFILFGPLTSWSTERSPYPKQTIVQAVIDHGSLQPYLHPEAKGRVPLRLSDHLIGSDLKLTKFGKPVQIIKDSARARAYLRFTVFDCKFGNYCNVVFEYPLEGLVGSSGVHVSPTGLVRLEKTKISETSRKGK